MSRTDGKNTSGLLGRDHPLSQEKAFLIFALLVFMLSLLSENLVQANHGNTGGATVTELTSQQRGLSLTPRGDVICDWFLFLLRSRGCAPVTKLVILCP